MKEEVFLFNSRPAVYSKVLYIENNLREKENWLVPQKLPNNTKFLVIFSDWLQYYVVGRNLGVLALFSNFSRIFGNFLHPEGTLGM